MALRLAASLRNFWSMSYKLGEGRLWLGRALERPHPASPDLAAAAAELGRIELLLGELEPAGKHVDEAVELAETLDLPDVLSEALNTRSALFDRAGRDDDALHTIEQALAIAREHELGRPLLRALNNLSVELALRDRDVDAFRSDLEGLELARARGNQDYASSFLFSVTSGSVRLGDWDGALRYAAEPGSWPDRDLARLTDLPWLFVQRGELDEARRTLERLAPLAARDSVQSRSIEALARAVVRRAEGRPQEALAAAEEVLAMQGALGGRHGYVKSGFVEAVEAAFALGDLERVAELQKEWERHSSERRTPVVAAHEQRFAARLGALRGETEGVESSFVRAAEIFREISFPFYVAVALLEHSEWLAGQDRRVDAEPLLAEAREIFQRVGARPWLERVSQPRLQSTCPPLG
jgi:tetratricopeptide (TPR) repeat protein